MRRYTLYDRLTAIAAGLCLCWLFMACGEDRGGDLPDDDPNSCVVTITLRTSRSARPPQTKAGETITWESDDEYERDITDWLVVAYDESGVLAGYTSSEGTYNKEDENSCTDVNMRLPVGTYRFMRSPTWSRWKVVRSFVRRSRTPTPAREIWACRKRLW